MKTNDTSPVTSRALEMLRSSEYSLTVTDFLSPGEIKEVYSSLSSVSGGSDRCFFWGGAVGCERCAAVFLPEWYMPPDAPRHSLPTDSDRTAFFAAFLKEHPEISDEIPITALRITGSGFSRLSHRDYMGSVLALGIDRSVIGDIVPVSEREAVVFAEEKIAPYIMSSLDKIGRDGVSVTRFSPDPEWVIPRRFSEMTLTVSSMRLDCIVKALTNLSREAAAETVRAGLVELSYSTDDNVSSSVKSGDIISVRGFGKFLIGDTDGETKSGRLRVRCKKYL